MTHQYPGGVSDCPYCRWLDNNSNLHIASPIYDKTTNQWRMHCGVCYRYGPAAGTARYAIKKWNELWEKGVKE